MFQTVMTLFLWRKFTRLKEYIIFNNVTNAETIIGLLTNVN